MFRTAIIIWSPQCKAGREWEHYQSKDPNPIQKTHGGKKKIKQDFLIIPSLGAAALETQRRCFSKVILASKVTPNIARSADSFSTVPSRVNGVNRGWTVHDLGTIIVLVLLAFSFIPHKLHHTLTLLRSYFIGSEMATLSLGMTQQAPEWSRQHNHKAWFPL